MLAGSGTLVVENTNGGTAPGASAYGRANFSGSANTFNGSVTVRDGGNFMNNTQNPSYAALTVDAGGYFTLVSNGSTSTITVGDLAGSGTFTKNVTSLLSVLAVGQGSFSGVIGESALGATGTVGLTKQGAGTLTLSGTSTYTGATAVNEGVLRAGASTSVFGGNSAVTLANTSGATLDLNGYDVSIGSLAGGGAAGGNVTLGAGMLTLGGNNASTTFAGVISGSGGLTKVGNGSLTLQGANTYAGGTVYNSGTGALQVSGDQSAATGGWGIGTTSSGGRTVTFTTGATIAVAAGRTFQIGNTAATGTSAQSLDVNGAAVANAGALIVGRVATLNFTANDGGVWNQSGPMSIQAVGGYGATVNVSAGALFTYSGTDRIMLYGGTNDSGTSRLNIAGGTFATSAGFDRTGDTPSRTQVNLSAGGTLRLTQSVPSLTQGVNSVQMSFGTGGGVIDTNGYDAGISTGISG
ncbi:MAG: autotransporter-associated beta strand repeat-containing protein, partial [Kiritimatiellia bacterium]